MKCGIFRSLPFEILKKIFQTHVFIIDGSGIICGIDISPVIVEKAIKEFQTQTASGKIDIGQGIVEALPYSSDLFDRIVHINCFHCWEDVPAGVSELYRVLKPQGLMVSTLNIKFNKKNQKILGKIDPLNYYMSLLEKVGFENVRIEYYKERRLEFQAIFAEVGNEKILKSRNSDSKIDSESELP